MEKLLLPVFIDWFLKNGRMWSTWTSLDGAKWMVSCPLVEKRTNDRLNTRWLKVNILFMIVGKHM